MRERRAGTLERFPRNFGKGLPGRPHTAESRAKIGAAVAGRKRTAAQRANISRARIGLRISDEARAATSERMRGERNPFFGRTHTAETRGKISAANRKSERYIDAHGYVRVFVPGHPRTRKSDGRVQEHVIVMEKRIGRYLTRGEVVHHINQDRADNRPENLQLLTRTEHARLHSELHQFGRKHRH